jgi:hypothetical protein
MKYSAKEKDLPSHPVTGQPAFDLAEFECYIWDKSRNMASSIVHAADWGTVAEPEIVVEMKHDSWFSGAGMLAGGAYRINLTLYVESLAGPGADLAPVIPPPVFTVDVIGGVFDYPEVTCALPALAPGAYRLLVTANCANGFLNIFHAYKEIGILQVEP